MSFLGLRLLLITYIVLTSIIHAQKPSNQNQIEFENIIKNKYEADLATFSKNRSNEDFKLIKEVLQNRKENTLYLLKNNYFILDGELYDFVNAVLNEIQTKNPKIKFKKLIIVKDESVNAYTSGEDLIYVNLGLLFRLKNADELAFVLCHELAHDQLFHFEENIKEYIQKSSDKEQEKKIKQIYREKYSHVSKLNELLLPGLLSDKKRRRQNELNADSLGYKFYTKTKFSCKSAESLFELLEKSDTEKDTNDIIIKDLIPGIESFVPISKLKLEKYESSLGAFDEPSDQELLEKKKKRKELEDLLRSHPYDSERKEKIKQIFNLDSSQVKKVEVLSKKISTLIGYNLLEANIQANELSRALFNNSILIHEYPNDINLKLLYSIEWAFLGFYKSKMKEGTVVHLQNEYWSKNYNTFLGIVSNLSPKECFTISKKISESLNTGIKSDINGKCFKLIQEYLKGNYAFYTTEFDGIKSEFKNSIYEKILNDIYEDAKFKK